MAQSAGYRDGVVRADSDAPLPLKEVAVKANVKGYVLGLVARMLYENDAEDPAEIIFRMPVEQSQAVVAMSAVVDGRKVKATIREKKRAEEMYDDAIASGFTAALGKTETDDIFSISLGNLRGGGEAEVELHFVEELPLDAEGNIRFSLPTTLKPRYTAVGSQDPLAPVVGESNQVKHGSFGGVQQFELKILEPESISAVTSPTHTINVSHDNVVNVTVSEGESLETDLVILIAPKDPCQPKALVEAGMPIGDDEEVGFMASPAVIVTFFPEIPEASLNLECEFIFLVDRSGSMSGSFIRSAAETLILFLKSLPEGSYFNIIGFGSGYESLFPASVPYNQENLDKGTSHAQSLQADLGGTEVLQPLQYIFNKCPPVKGLSRQIFLLTDGSVSNSLACIEEVKKNAHKARCFTFGIGSGASSFLVDGIAKAGCGTAEFVKENERLQPKVVRSLKHAMQPAVVDVSVSFNVPQEIDVTQVPTYLPPLYDGNKLLVYGLLSPASKKFRLKEISGHAVLRGSLLGQDIKHQIPFSASLAPLLPEDVFPVHRLAAKTSIKEMEESNRPAQSIANFSVETSVISRETAFIAVEESSEQVVGAMKTYDVLMKTGFLDVQAATVRGMHLLALQQQALLTVEDLMEQADNLANASTSFKKSSGLASSLGSALGSAASTVSGWFSRTKRATASAPHSQVVSDGFAQEKEYIDDLDEEITPCSQVVSDSFVQEGGYMEELEEAKCADKSDDSIPLENEPLDLGMPKPSRSMEPMPTLQPPPTCSPSAVVALQQANGSWLLSDNLLVLLGLDRASVEAGCPPDCEVLVWATVLALTLLKLRCGKEQEELELVTNKAKSWLGKQPLPNEVTLEKLYAAAEKLLT